MSQKILVLDDEDFLREILAEELTEEGYEVFSAVDSSQAMQILNQNKIDLVLTDMMLPAQTGLDFIQKANQEIEHRSKYILITGRIDLEFADVQSKGVDALLAKPFSVCEMSNTIKGILSGCAPHQPGF